MIRRTLALAVLAVVLATGLSGDARASHHSYRATMMTTAYCDRGYMADGRYVYAGAAAGGYDLPLGATVYVPGVGRLRIEDRIGYRPWYHVDVWMASCAAAIRYGVEYKTVTVAI